MENRYKEALDYLFSQLPMFSRTGAAAYKPGLDTSINLALYFDNPQNKFKSIHVGGTNGKGSTSHMIASVLQAQGYKTGLYTSPHLVDFRERIRINGKMIPKEEVVKFTEEWKKTEYDGQPSFFELTMIMAFHWFAKENVDFAVIEVGMGGRLDSTNIINPKLCVITNISHDHNQFLGDTLDKIAREKAGIIKKGVPTVIGETQPETQQVFRNKAEKEDAPILFADSTPISLHINEGEGGWNYRDETLDITLPLGGDYQKKNLATVIAAIKEVRKIGFEISDSAIKEGIENVAAYTGFAGRWTIISTTPLTIADTGHNIAGLTYNFKQLERLRAERPGCTLRIVIGFVADKAINKILNILPEDALYYVTNALIPRALPAATLLDKFLDRGFKAEMFENVRAAYSAAKEEASAEDIIFIGGSTFIVADFLHYFYAGHDS